MKMHTHQQNTTDTARLQLPDGDSIRQAVVVKVRQPIIRKPSKDLYLCAPAGWAAVGAKPRLVQSVRQFPYVNRALREHQHVQAANLGKPGNTGLQIRCACRPVSFLSPVKVPEQERYFHHTSRPLYSCLPSTGSRAVKS